MNIGFTTHFSTCSAFAGWGPVSLAVAQTLVPAVLSQIGVNPVCLYGIGTINTYTLVCMSNNPFLVLAFQLAGLPARYDQGITYQYTLNEAGTGGTL